MCIRDRTYLAGYLEADVFFTNDFAGRIGVRTEHSKHLDKTNFAPRMSFAYRLGVYDQLNFCLLYTSDAADERSSVDLGGRRIIKKKQQRAVIEHISNNH